jgi:hypothetical protein
MTTPLKHYNVVHNRDIFADENSNFNNQGDVATKS